MVKEGVPRAMRDTLSTTAVNARKSARRMIDENLVIKGGKSSNPAVRGVQFEKAKTLDPKRMSSSVGHVAAFWPLQEFGGSAQRGGSTGVAIPTGAAASQAGTNKRTKQVTARNRLSRVKLSRTKVQARNRKQRNALLIAAAKSGEGSKEVFLDLGRRKGIFRVTKRKITMLYDLSSTNVRVPASPAIYPAAERQAAFIPENFERALRFQLRKAQRRR